MGENKFAHKVMKIRPDNAGGFLNLQRPLKEMNNRYARPKGFSFLDDFEIFWIYPSHTVKAVNLNNP